ncbi:DUF1611 domain-containing protein [Algoriphagus lacus]|uniref:DUF1611 domain-containing protein n=1 Tax=Algoriphagus lacus TaxID=2056311 RepID=A0A418PQD3_9BACT|nr:DUF1611 domain-containing protein [Algoriphagus lacus]RIW14527.1 DUF1611 domain-containing protein [Algoriphagus lacus]
MENRIKKGILCDQIKPNHLIPQTELSPNHAIQAGDIALFEVTEIGKHTQIQTAGRNMTLAIGDLIMGAFGARYATNQFEGYVPEHPQEEYHMLGGGGIIGILESAHSKLEKEGPTRLKMVGFAADQSGQIINSISQESPKLKRFDGSNAAKTKVILSLGSSMDSGKTTTAAFLCHGFAKQGIKSAYIKLTGTAYPKDRNLAYDMGAGIAIDFVNYGFPSTYLRSEIELLNLYETLLEDVFSIDPEYVVVEIADGLFQRETKMLLQNPVFMNTVHQVVFSSGDSLAAVQGVHTLNNWGIMPAALSGLFTASPLLIKEVREYLSERQDLPTLPILTLEDLTLGKWPINKVNFHLLQA